MWGSNSRVFRFFKNVFSWKADRRGQAYVPVSTYGTSREETVQQSPPKDNYRIVYLIFLLQGVAMLSGWNVFITASVFFHQSFLGSAYADNFQNYFSVVFMSSNLFFLGLALFTQKPENISRRIIIAITLMIINFLLIAISTQYVEFFSPTSYFYFVITLVGIAGATTALQQNDIFALVAQFPPIYTQSVMSGQGLAGFAISVFEILSALATHPTNLSVPTKDDLRYSALLYFLGAVITALLALISYFILIYLPLYLHCIQTREQFQMIQNVEINTTLIKTTFNKIRILAFAAGFVFFVTLALFPSITASIKSVVEDENKDEIRQDYLFIPLHFLVNNLGDWFGRCLPSLQTFFITDPVKLAQISIARIIFLPIFLMCNVDVGSNGVRVLPLVINSDLIYFLMLWLFAVSNGYISSLTTMAAPQVEGVQKDLAGTIMVFCLVFGLTIGSIFSFPIRAISPGYNPIGN